MRNWQDDTRPLHAAWQVKASLAISRCSTTSLLKVMAAALQQNPAAIGTISAKQQHHQTNSTTPSLPTNLDLQASASMLVGSWLRQSWDISGSSLLDIVHKQGIFTFTALWPSCCC
jgi:hypothetical protein